MINRLIDIKAIPKVGSTSKKYTAEDYAISFLNGLSNTQRNRFKAMLENNIECGQSVAKSYGIDYDIFINAVKKILFV